MNMETPFTETCTDDDPYVDIDTTVPDYSLTLTPTIVDSDDDDVPCSDWKNCLSSAFVLFLAVLYGFVCGMAGYRLQPCDKNCSD